MHRTLLACLASVFLGCERASPPPSPEANVMRATWSAPEVISGDSAAVSSTLAAITAAKDANGVAHAICWPTLGSLCMWSPDIKTQRLAPHNVLDTQFWNILPYHAEGKSAVVCVTNERRILLADDAGNVKAITHRDPLRAYHPPSMQIVHTAKGETHVVWESTSVMSAHLERNSLHHADLSAPRSRATLVSAHIPPLPGSAPVDVPFAGTLATPLGDNDLGISWIDASTNVPQPIVMRRWHDHDWTDKPKIISGVHPVTHDAAFHAVRTRAGSIVFAWASSAVTPGLYRAVLSENGAMSSVARITTHALPRNSADGVSLAPLGKNGEAMIVSWHTSSEPGAATHYARTLVGSTMSPIVRLTKNRRANTDYDLTLARDGIGAVHKFWFTRWRESRQIHHRWTNDGVTWSMPTVVSGSSVASGYTLSEAPFCPGDPRLLLTWADTKTHMLVTSIVQNDTSRVDHHANSGPVVLDSGTKALVDGHGNAHVFWMSRIVHGPEIMHTVFTGTKWSAPTVVSGQFVPSLDYSHFNAFCMSDQSVTLAFFATPRFDVVATTWRTPR
jgi:hypothetical protein